MSSSVPGSLRLIAVLALAASLVPVPGLVPPARAQEGNAGVHGTLYEADEKEKLAGARVIAINVKTGKQYFSGVTGDNGDFDVIGLPGGTYDIAIEIGGSLFVADNLVDLAASQNLGVSYSVQPLRPANRKLAGLKQPQGSATPIGGFHGTEGAVAGTTTGGGRSFWTSTGGIVLLGVLAGGVGYAIEHNRNNNNASPSMP